MNSFTSFPSPFFSFSNGGLQLWSWVLNAMYYFLTLAACFAFCLRVYSFDINVFVDSVKEGKWENSYGCSLPEPREYCRRGIVFSCFNFETFYWVYLLIISKSFLFLFAVILSHVIWFLKLQVVIEPIHGKKVEHTGVKIELLGQIGVLHLLHVFHFRFTMWKFDESTYIAAITCLFNL